MPRPTPASLPVDWAVSIRRSPASSALATAASAARIREGVGAQADERHAGAAAQGVKRSEVAHVVRGGGVMLRFILLPYCPGRAVAARHGRRRRGGWWARARERGRGCGGRARSRAAVSEAVVSGSRARVGAPMPNSATRAAQYG